MKESGINKIIQEVGDLEKKEKKEKKKKKKKGEEAHHRSIPRLDNGYFFLFSSI